MPAFKLCSLRLATLDLTLSSFLGAWLRLGEHDDVR